MKLPLAREIQARVMARALPRGNELRDAGAELRFRYAQEITLATAQSERNASGTELGQWGE